nr:MAG TPA: hypothetical protein [Bacteriophage sp.]
MKSFSACLSTITSGIFAYIWVVAICLCPSILETDSIETSFKIATVVANVCLAICTI